MLLSRLYILLISILLGSTLFAQDTTLTITNYGYVGIGYTTPVSKLDVAGSFGSGDLVRFSNHMLSSRVAADNKKTDVAIFGANEGTSGFEVGVYGRTQSPDGYGVYSAGNLKVDGETEVTGNIKAHAINTGTGNLKIVQGVISPTGKILSGNGFKVEHSANDPGKYTIILEESFATYPSANGIVVNFAIVQIGSLGSGKVIFWIRKPDSGDFMDSNFSFTLIGPAIAKTEPAKPKSAIESPK